MSAAMLSAIVTKACSAAFLNRDPLLANASLPHFVHRPFMKMTIAPTEAALPYEKHARKHCRDEQRKAENGNAETNARRN